MKTKKKNPGFFISRNKCLGCCLSCDNKDCILCEDIKGCDSCKNYKCIYNGYLCKDYDCLSCRNYACVNNGKFDPKKQIAINC